MVRAGLTRASVAREALAIVDESGSAGLTLAAVATRVGVSTPSLYAHVDSLGQLRSLIQRLILEEITDTLQAALVGVAGEDAIRTLLHELRSYALAHPFRYQAMPQQPLDDEHLLEAGAALLRVFTSVLRFFGLEDSDAVHATRRLRAAAHGFLSLELAGGFGLPEDVDESYARLADMVVSSIVPPRETIEAKVGSSSGNSNR